MSSRLVFAGSKRAARRLLAEQREADRVKRELNAIYQLAQTIRDEAHLQQILADVADDAQRSAVAKLLEPFLAFRVRRVEVVPVLSPTDLTEMKMLVERVQKGSVSREDWSNLAALTVMYQGDETIVAIASQGLDTFIAISKPIFEDHAFQHEDFRRMYDRICVAAARYEHDLVRH